MINKTDLVKDFNAVKSQSPLIHNITNFVVMNNTANALLAVGASPVMAHAVNEVEEMVGIASSLVINIGTLNDDWIEGMKKAGCAAHNRNIPLILDPVGAGATSYRTKTALDIIALCHPSIIRGNGSEIMALVNASIKTKGVDSSADSDRALSAAKFLAGKFNCVVVISGPTDYITDGNRVQTVKNGSTMMTKVTGLGCSASAMVGAFAAVNLNQFDAAVHAMAIMSIAGERAAAYSKGTGSMQVNFLDELYQLSDDMIEKTLIPD